MALVGSTIPIEYRKLVGQPMKIGRYVNIGMHCTILPIDEIPEGCAIGANSLINRKPESWSIYVGSPAKFLKPRRKDLLDRSKDLCL